MRDQFGCRFALDRGHIRSASYIAFSIAVLRVTDDDGQPLQAADESEPDEPVGNLDQFDVAAVGMKVRPDLSESVLERASPYRRVQAMQQQQVRYEFVVRETSMMPPAGVSRIAT